VSLMDRIRQMLLRRRESAADRGWAPRIADNNCCMDPDNLTTIERDAHVLVRRCKCGRRHFRAIMPLTTGHVRMTGHPTGGR